MYKHSRFQTASVFLLGLALLGCSESTNTNTTQGFHFQGRDCLACHNVDLSTEKHLFIGGSLFKDKNTADVNNLDTLCGGGLIVNFLTDNTNPSSVVYSSKDFTDSNAKGSNGKGNVFVLKRKNTAVQGDYFVQITDEKGTELAVSGGTHSFTNNSYDIANPTDTLNRYSCNSCHSQNGTTSPLYVKSNVNNCQ